MEKKKETRCRSSTAMATEQQIYFLNHKYVSLSYQITETRKDPHLQAKSSLKKHCNVLSGLEKVLFQLSCDSCPHKNGKIATCSWLSIKNISQRHFSLCFKVSVSACVYVCLCVCCFQGQPRPIQPFINDIQISEEYSVGVRLETHRRRF